MNSVIDTTKERAAPVRNGAVYCSPWCNNGCTHADYERATREAVLLARKMNVAGPSGWSPRVWENLGWHFQIVKGTARISKIAAGAYTVMYYTAIINGQYIGDGEAPEKAFQKALQRMKSLAEEIAEQIAALERPVA